ncbi:MAG: methyl-accepting chemotaxis protein, partial [Cyanobacteria bacterium J083]
LVADCCGENNQELNKDNLEFLQQIAQELGIILERVSLLEQERLAKQERIAKEQLQQRILDLLLEVDPVSRGDLTIRAKVTDDEIGTVADSYNSTIESLNLLVSKVKTVANQVQTTASCNEEAIKQLSNEAITQAETITEVVKNIQSMNESIRQIAANATTAENAVLEANQTVEAGEMAMDETVTGILAIRDTVTETTEKVKRLEESSANISGIINLIGRFAAQTHLLALKASIEAARAGDKGKGSAVIADEVRSLAAQSAEATNQIENLVAKIQVDTKEVMEAMVTGTEQVVKGTELVERTRLSLNQITNSSLKIERLVQDISQATIEQNQTSELVVTTIEEVAKIAQNNSLAASQVLASFEDLLSLAEQLQADVGKFKVK